MFDSLSSKRRSRLIAFLLVVSVLVLAFWMRTQVTRQIPLSGGLAVLRMKETP